MGWVLVALVCLAILSMTVRLGWRGATELIHPPHRRAIASPADYHLSFENISFATRDGLTLRGWFIPAENPHGTIVVCHGYTGDCSPDLQYAPLFHQHDYNMLFFDFRGHGMSDGDYTSLVYFERTDLLAALDHLQTRGIAQAGLFGLSMGGAIALATAPLSPMVVGVVSDSTFDELWRMIAHQARKRGFPPIFAQMLGGLVIAIASLRLRANLFSADPVWWVGKIAPRPILLMHGSRDDDAPNDHAQRLFDAAREPKELWNVPNAAHRKIEEIARDEYRQRLVEFFDRAFANH